MLRALLSIRCTTEGLRGGGGLIGTEPTFATKPIEGSSKLNPHVPVPIRQRALRVGFAMVHTLAACACAPCVAVVVACASWRTSCERSDALPPLGSKLSWRDSE